MSDLALRLINENKACHERGEDAAKHLDLANCGLTVLPRELFELNWLEELILSSGWRDTKKRQYFKSENEGPKNRLTVIPDALENLKRLTILVFGSEYNEIWPISDLAPLAKLEGLQELHLSYTQISDLAPLAKLEGLQTLDLSYTQISDLSPLAKLEGLQELYLSSTQISDLAPLAKLEGLQTLYLHSTQISDLAPLAKLEGLQTFDLGSTQISDLAPLAKLEGLQTLYLHSTQISDLATLARLEGLQTLYLNDTQISDIAPLAKLEGLQILDLSSTQISDLAPLAKLVGLQILHLGYTQISDLATLARLEGLQTLYLNDTQISDIAPLAKLVALQEIDLSDTQISDLSPLIMLIQRGCPVKWSSNTLEGEGIYVLDCPLINPPPEIVNQSNEAILNYFKEREKGEIDHLYEAKMLILGEGRAGKTSLLRRLYQPDEALPTEKETTKGIDIYQHKFIMNNGQTFRLNVWDFGGQEIYHATHQFFLTRRSLYLLVDDTSKDYKSVSDEGFKYWLEMIDVFSEHSPVLIFQNEKGGRSKAIDIGGIKGRFDNVKELYAGNLEHKDASDQLRDGIEYFSINLSHIGDELPASWIKVRKSIENRAIEVPYISRQDYFDIYSNHIDFDRSKALHLSRYLHDLGVFLHFQDDPLLERTVILQNEWATEAVFKILDDEIVKGKLGRFSGIDCERLWQDSMYSDMHPELLALMQRFELCYQLNDISPPTWLAPQLLPPSKPQELHEWSKIKDLVLRYRYDFLPKGIISRLTVRLHRFVYNPEMAWVTGVLFERNGTKLLVELMANGTEIELRARGPERKELLSVVAADLDALNDSFRGLRGKVDKRIPCNCRICRSATKPTFFDQSELLRRKEHNKLRVECPTSFEEIDVIELLDGISVEMLPGWVNEKQSAASFCKNERSVVKCFISYAHFYQDYFEVFRNDFEAQTANLQFCDLDIWTDEKIPLGENWHKAIQEQVSSCDVAIFLVSDRFMTSDYIKAEEVARLFERNETEGTLVISVYFYPCRFHDWSVLKESQLFKPKGEDYGRADQKERFCFADLVKLNNVHGKNIAQDNPNRSRYMMDFIEALEPQLKEIADRK